MASVRLTMDVRDQGWQEGASLDRISELLDDGGNLLWLDIRDPGPAELELLRREFGFHELALEHVEQRHQRPRCIPFSGYCFMVVYTAEHTGDELVPQELQLFWGPNYLVTIHRGVLAVLDEARRRWQSHESRRPDGVGYLVYTLFDSLVDTYFTLQDWVGERVDATEEAILAGDRRAGGDIFKLRKQLVDIRRLTAPTGDVLAEALRRHPSLPETLRPYFADVQDHCAHVLGELEAYGALLSAALDIHAETWFGRLGELMKRLTAITIIIMVPNLVASIYGMNFTKLFPPSDWEWGFPLIVGLIAVMIAWGFIHSRYLDWL